jgi:hypothetical protein
MMRCGRAMRDGDGSVVGGFDSRSIGASDTALRGSLTFPPLRRGAPLARHALRSAFCPPPAESET